MGNLLSRKYRIQPVQEQYTNRCRNCRYLFLSPHHKELNCPICAQQSNQSQSIESETDSLIIEDEISN
jgi:hypothetical protein